MSSPDADSAARAGETTGAQGLRRWFPQVMSVVSWIVLLYLALCFIMGDRLGPLLLGGGYVMVALPVLSLWAAVSFLFDKTRTRAWVGPSNVIFLLLSAIPSLLIGGIYTIIVAYLVFE